MKYLFTLVLAFAASTSQAQILATYVGSIQKVSASEYLTGKGYWKAVPQVCRPYVRPQSFGFAASAEKSLAASSVSCPQAEITVDLEGSSFCRDQGGREIYFAPTVVAVKCF